MSNTQKLHEDTKDDDTIHNTFTTVRIGTSVLPPQIHSQNPKDGNKKCECSCPIPILLPFGQFIFVWNVLLIFILVFSIVEIPYSVAFEIHAEPLSFVAIFGFFIDMCLLFDIVLSFRTAYIDKYDRLRIIHDPVLIAKRYLKTWFVIDFLAATPFTYFVLLFTEGRANDSAIFVFFRLLRIIKLVRILKILKMFKVFRQNFTNKMPSRTTRMVLTLGRTLCLMLFFAHYLACFWYAIGLSAHEQNLNSWMDVIVENGDENKGNFVKYSYAFYFSIVTLFTTGYGDIHACNIYEHWTCSFAILVGSCFFAYFISVLTSGLADDLKHQSKSERIEQSLEFCAHYNLPKEVSRAVVTHMRYYNDYNFLFDAQITMNALPNYLQNEIAQHLASSVLTELDIFESLPPNVIGQIGLKLKCISVGENQFLFKAGDNGKELFIQRTGKSRLIHNGVPNKLKDRHLNRGDVVGENCILARQRQHSVMTLIWSEFYVLDIEDIVSVLRESFESNEAEKQWTLIKKVIADTKSESKIFSEISEDVFEVCNADPRHRHVRFNNEMKNFQSYLDPKLMTPRASVTSKAEMHRTFSEEELALEEEDLQRKRKKSEKLSFKSVKRLFMDRQTSHSRNKKVRSHYDHTNNKGSVATLAYSHVSGKDLDLDQNDADLNDYLFAATPAKSTESTGNQSVNSAGFFSSSPKILEENMFGNGCKQKQTTELIGLRRDITHRNSEAITPLNSNCKKSSSGNEGESVD